MTSSKKKRLNSRKLVRLMGTPSLKSRMIKGFKTKSTKTPNKDSDHHVIGDTAEDEENGEVVSTGSSVDAMFDKLQGGSYYGESKDD
jgi:hypothetical protein